MKASVHRHKTAVQTQTRELILAASSRPWIRSYTIAALLLMVIGLFSSAEGQTSSTNLVQDPQFDQGVSGFFGQDASTVVARTTNSPLEGAASLHVAINGFGNNVWWTFNPTAPASQFRISAHLRSDVASSSTLQFCAMVNYQDGTQNQNCTPVTGAVGDKGTVLASLALDQTKPIESVRIRLNQEGSEGLSFTLDAAAAFLDAGSGGGSDTQAPAVPANLGATAVSSSAINLSWTASTDNVGVTGYKVFRDSTQIATATTTSYSDTGLSPSTTHVYTVSAFDAAGNTSAQSASASATTQPAGGVSVSINPANATLQIGGAQQFSATVTGSTNTAVTWSATGGTISTTGNYTAPNQAGTFTVTARSVADTTKSQSATVTVVSSSVFSTHGLAIPVAHPRLWWTPSRIAAAQSWAQSHTVSLGSTAFANHDINAAWQHVVQGADCSQLVTTALRNIPSYAQTLPNAIGSDDVRGGAEPALIVFDWCYDQFGATSSVNTTTTAAISIAQAVTIPVASTAGMFIGQDLVIDTGANQETIIISDIPGSSTITGYNVTKAHAPGVPVVGMSQKASFINNWNYWLGNVDQQFWGGLSMPQNNYFAGNLRNDIEWGIASYGDNGVGTGSIADNFLQAGLGQVGESGSATRWTDFKTSALGSGGSAGFGGGVPSEGTEYGTAFEYSMIPFQSTQLMGRDVFNESDYYKQLMIWLVYGTTPAPTFNIGADITAYQMFTWGDDERTADGGILAGRNYWQDLANVSSNYFSNIPIGQYTRQWYNTVTSDLNTMATDMFVLSQDANPPASSFSNLPLDYYATGIQYAWLRSAWDSSSTALMLQMGDSTVGGGKHEHRDFGNFSIWRGGRWLMRETTGYSDTIAGTPGINGNANQMSESPFAHNVPIFTNVALGQASNPTLAMPTAYKSGPIVKRLETQPGYFYSDTDLTGGYLWDTGHSFNDTGAVQHVEREFLYVRGLETLVVFDRILTGNQTFGTPGGLTASQIVTSSITHFETLPTQTGNVFTSANGTQVVRQTVLVPASVPTPRIINEQSCSGCSRGIGQFRLEVDNSGAPQRYLLNVIQTRSNTQGDVTATVVDSAPSDPNTGTFTVRLHPSSGADTVIVFNKGQTSVGGTIAVVGAGAVNLRTNVQQITYSDSGPAWLP